MKIIAISDTHNKHNKLTLPECDILIHSGDISFKGQESEVRNFAKWFNKQKAKHKIFVPGNHELIFEKSLPMSKEWFYEKCPNGILLMHEMVEIEGLKIFGSPYSPRFFNWAFNVDRGPEIKRYWDMIPEDINVLVTHGPPAGILDAVTPGNPYDEDRVGCEDLMNRILELKNLKIHIFGHIHESYGHVNFNGVKFYNAAICDDDYIASHKPLEIEI